MLNANHMKFFLFGLLLMHWSIPSSALGLNTTVNGSLGDLDGNMDGGTAEAAVLQTAVNCWDARITTNRNFTLTVNTMALTGARGTGGTTTVTAGIPTAGRITMDDGTGIIWYVDPTPLDSLEFTPDPNNQWRFINGTGAAAAADLLRAVMHEIGHAQGWVCGNAACSRTTDNFNYDGLMVPQPANFVTSTNVSLQWLPGFNVPLRGDGLPIPQVNELSHVGPFGPFNSVGDLMFGRTGNGRRETPSVNDVDMFMHAYTDAVNFPPTINAGANITSECNAAGGSNVTLDASGSSDPENDILTFSWMCPTVTLTNPSTAMASGFFPLSQPETCRVDATDLAACSADADTVNVTVVDTTAPNLTCPADQTFECTATGGTPATDSGIASFLSGATATDTCDATLAIADNAPPFFNTGTTAVMFATNDDSSNGSACTATVTVADTTPPVVECNTPGTITPPDAPISFAATATDICGAVTTQITEFDCFDFTKKGKRIDKTESCVVSFAGDTVTIDDSGGVGDRITWTVQATDADGNITTEICFVDVENPGRGS